MGTLRYLAPEQLRGEPATAGDRHPFPGGCHIRDARGASAIHARRRRSRLAEAQDAGAEPLLNVAPALDNAVRRALAPDPADRPADMAAFADELRNGLANEPTELIVGLPAQEP